MALVIALISIQSGGLVNVMPGAWVSFAGGHRPPRRLGRPDAPGRAPRPAARRASRRGSRSSPSWCCSAHRPLRRSPTPWTSRTARSSRSSSCSSAIIALDAHQSRVLHLGRASSPQTHRRVLMLGAVRSGVPVPVHPGRLGCEHVDRHPGADLRVHGPGPQHRRRPRRPARPRLHRLPGCRRLRRSDLLRLRVRHGRLEAAVPRRRHHRRAASPPPSA